MVNIELTTDELFTLTVLVSNRCCFGDNSNSPFMHLFEKLMRSFDNVKEDLTEKEREYVSMLMTLI